MDFEKPATIKALAYFHAILNVIINIHFIAIQNIPTED